MCLLRDENEVFLKNKSVRIKEATVLPNNASLSVRKAFHSRRQFSADSVKNITWKMREYIALMCYKCYKYIKCIQLQTKMHMQVVCKYAFTLLTVLILRAMC